MIWPVEITPPSMTVTPLTERLCSIGPLIRKIHSLHCPLMVEVVEVKRVTVWVLSENSRETHPSLVDGTVPSESIHTPQLFPHFIVLPPEFKMN